MKSIIESIIGKRGSEKFTKNQLQPGYVVRYRDEDLAMYFAPEDILRISRIKYLSSKCGNEGCFVCGVPGFGPNWAPVHKYDNNLNYAGGKPEFDIIEIYPIKTDPQFLNYNELERLISGISPIKINQ